MIDYVKINDLIAGHRIQDLLDFEIKVNHRTGEELYRKRNAYLKNLVFTVTPGNRFVKMSGSLHKFSNAGDLNNDRFTFDRFRKVSDELQNYISDHDRINTIEFGVNIILSWNPSDLIQNLICHLKKPFNRTIRTGISYSQVEYKHFIIKIYNKGLQQPSGVNILRFEVKFLRMQKIFPGGLVWSDLRNLETWSYLGDILRKKFSEVLFYDPSINLKDITTKDQHFLKEGKNPFYWQDLTGPHVSRIRKQYQTLVRKYGEKFNNLPELLDQEIKDLVKKYNYLNESYDMKNSVKYHEMVKSLRLLYANNSPRVKCPVTGHDISMQKRGSRFLSIAGIKYLYRNHQDLYEKLKSDRLSDRWLHSPIDIQIREIAHSVRNQFFNPSHNARKTFRKVTSDPVLFDVAPTLSAEKRRLIYDH